MNNILLVDDAPDVAATVQAALTEAGNMKVDISETASGAIEKVRKNNYDLVLIDVVLGDGNGFDLFSKIRGLENSASLPLIFLTSQAGVNEKVSAFSLGADDYIVNPFNLRELRARVQRRLRA